VRNQSLCPVCNEVVERHQLVRGYKFEKGQYVQFTEAELDTLEIEANSNIKLRVYQQSRKWIRFIRGRLLPSTDQSGENAYRLRADAMKEAR
jgi:DNA end-binding protein Ku